MKCFECIKEAVYDHHVVPKCLGGTKTVPLCGDCHKKVHSPVSGLSIRSLLPQFRVPNKVTLEMRKRIMGQKGKQSSREVSKLEGVSHDTVCSVWNGESGIHRIHAKLQSIL